MDTKNLLNGLLLNRYPNRDNDVFQAWNSADEYIIKYLEENPLNAKNILIIEDEFGALTLNIDAQKIYVLNDSILSKKGIESNLKQNKLTHKNINYLSPFEDLPHNIDLVILKIPKSNIYLEFLLKTLQFYLKEHTPIIASAMLKYLNKGVFELFSLCTSEYKSSLAWKKSRILTAKTSKNKLKAELINTISDYELKLINYPNLFSYDKIDIGSRFFVENFKTDKKDVYDIVDLACGNGIMGLYVAKLFPNAKLHFTDIAYSAIKSSQESCKTNLCITQSSFYQMSSLNEFPDNSADLILINPPFHDKHKISLDTAMDMFNDAKRVLKKNGELFVVANRHLGYQVSLTNLFNNCTIISENEKFVLFQIKLTNLIKH